MNSLSSFAQKLMKKALSGDMYPDIGIPEDKIFREITDEVYNVPERPVDFSPNYFYLPNEKYDIALLVSGGLDSTCAYLMAKEKMTREPDAYYIDMGQTYALKEIKTLKNMGISFEIIKVEKIPNLDKNLWKHIHPARNFYYLSLVAERMSSGGEIWLGALNGEMPERGGDKSKRFIKLVNKLFRKCLPYKVKVRTPLSRYTKTDLVKWGIKRGYIDILKKTISCFSPEKGRCGECQSCFRTWVAFYNNGIDLEFRKNPPGVGKKHIEKYTRLMTRALESGDFSHYSKKRCKQTLKAIKNWSRIKDK